MNPTFYSENDYRLYHHGILGMKWGVRRYQNKDGSLTTAGRSRYRSTGYGAMKAQQRINSKRSANRSGRRSARSEGKKGLSDKQKRALKIGLGIAGAAVATYGAIKLGQAVKMVDTESMIDANRALSKIISDGSTKNNLHNATIKRLTGRGNSYYKSLGDSTDVARKVIKTQRSYKMAGRLAPGSLSGAMKKGIRDDVDFLKNPQRARLAKDTRNRFLKEELADSQDTLKRELERYYKSLNRSW